MPTLMEAKFDMENPTRLVEQALKTIIQVYLNALHIDGSSVSQKDCDTILDCCTAISELRSKL